MSALSVNPPFPIFLDIDGQPLDAGYIYLGVANQATEANPIQAYWDAALSVPATQPILTKAGFPVNAGVPARVYVNSDYSIVVKNRNGFQVFSSPIATDRFNDAVVNIDSSDVTFLQAGTGAVARTAQAKMRDVVSVKDFGAACDWNGSSGTDDTAAIQTAINYCVANQKDLLIPGLSLISASLNIDRLVDSAAADNYFTISSDSGGGIVVSSAIAMFSTTLVNPSDANLPVSQMIRFSGLKFESTNNALAAYVLDQNKLFRLVFESCNFRKIKCLNAPANKLTQTITFQNCQARRWAGTFFKSDEATFDLKVLGGLWEAGGDGFDIDFPVGTAFIGTNIEGMASFAIKYTAGYALTIQGCYFEENGNNDASGCSIDGSASTGVSACENVAIIGNYFSGDSDTPTKPQVKWGDGTTAISSGNLCTTTLHQFATNSRVNVVADYARTELSTNDSNSPYNGIRNEIQIGHVYRADGNYTYGGLSYASFVSGRGGFLRLRSLQAGVVSTNGVDIDENGDTNVSGTLRLNPAASVNPAVNGEVVIQATSNTSLTFKLKGSDGVVRSGSITLT